MKKKNWFSSREHGSRDLSDPLNYFVIHYRLNSYRLSVKFILD